MRYSTYEKWVIKDQAPTVNFGGGKGTSPEEAFILSEPAHLMKLAEDVNNGQAYSSTFFRLACDIDMRGIAFKPIGYCTGPFDKKEFSGIFDGGNHEIFNFHIDPTEDKSLGVFGYLEYATIQNLNIKAFSIKATGPAGGLAGYSETSTIANCHIEGTVSSVGGSVGGLVGIASNTTIGGCRSACEVDLVQGIGIGGLCGYVYNNSNITDCHAGGNITAKDSNDVGGFAGSIRDSSLIDAHATGSVAALDCTDVGGFGGMARDCKLTGCCAKGDVSSVNGEDFGFVGGLLGYTNSVIRNCYAVGRVIKTGSKGSLGGLVGDTSRSTITNSYAAGDVCGEGYVGGFVGLINNIGEIDTKIENCYAAGNIIGMNGESRCAGFVGKIDQSGGSVLIAKCYAYGEIMEQGKGFVAINTYGTISACFWRKDKEINGGINDGHAVPALPTERFENMEVFTDKGWGFGGPESAWLLMGNTAMHRPQLDMSHTQGRVPGKAAAPLPTYFPMRSTLPDMSRSTVAN